MYTQYVFSFTLFLKEILMFVKNTWYPVLRKGIAQPLLQLGMKKRDTALVMRWKEMLLSGEALQGKSKPFTSCRLHSLLVLAWNGE